MFLIGRLTELDDGPVHRCFLAHELNVASENAMGETLIAACGIPGR
jgi:hypothetical protein